MEWKVLELDSSDPAFPSHYPYYDYAFWINKKGWQSYQLTPKDTADYLIEVAKRDYFKKHDEWVFPGADSNRFRIESIVSFTSGIAKGAFSIPSETRFPVLALTTRFHSLIDPIIPKDYGFCMVDQEGNTWFHSNQDKNLRENFLRECNNNQLLRAALYGNVRKAMNVNYNDEPHRIYISPLANLPVYLITFYKKEAEQSYQAQVFTYTLAFTAALFLFIFIQSIALIILEKIYVRKVNRNLLLEMTRPRKKLNEKYVALFWLYILLIILFSVFMAMINGFAAIIAIFSFVSIVYVFSYRFLNEQDSRSRNRIWFTFGNLVLIVFFNIIGMTLVPARQMLLTGAFQLLLLGIIYVFNQNRNLFRLFPSTNFSKNYVLFLMGLLVMMGVIPTLKFYEVAYDQESEIRARHQLTHLAGQRENRNQRINNMMNNADGMMNTDRFIQERKELGIYTGFLNKIEFIRSEEIIEKVEPVHHSLWEDLITYVRPIYDEYVTENKFLLSNLPEESHFEWGKSGSKTYLIYKSATEEPDEPALTTYAMSIYVPHLSYLAPFTAKSYSGFEKALYNLLFWLFIISLLYLVNHLVRFGTRRIYSLYLIEMYAHHQFGSIIRQRLASDRHMMVVRLSPFDETTEIKDDFSRPDHSNYFNWSNPDEIEGTAEMADILNDESAAGDEEITDSNTVVIDLFDWNYANPSLFIKKLTELDYLIEKRETNLIVVSQVHPDRILEHYNPYAGGNGAGDGGQTGPLHSEIYYFFREITEKMITRYVPVNYRHSWKEENKACEERDTPRIDLEFIDRELSSSDYLGHYKPAVQDYLKSQDTDLKEADVEDRIMIRINTLAEKYYEGLLDSCTPEEKYVLYDLATDLVMNPKNSRVIFNLLENGLLIKKCDSIDFMNESFRKFVLDTIDKETFAEIEESMGKDRSSWQGYRTTLLLVIAGLFVFISLGNREFLDNLNQLFVVIGGGMAVITGVLGFISKKGKGGGDS
jgi:hypothetical protein